MKKVVLASRNEKKVKELASILAPWKVEVVPVSAFPEANEVEETGTTFEANAILKAESVCADTGLPALADDSGLAVDALDGAPGVYSARFSGPDATDASNNALLLEKLSGREDRSARFCCVIAFARPGEETLTFYGESEGDILTEARGDCGFGYDPLFLSRDLKKTFAEADGEEKHSVSHRGRALKSFFEKAKELF